MEIKSNMNALSKRITKDGLKANISKNLRNARATFEPKLTQEGVANLFDPPLTRAAVAQWEVGETLPDIDRLAILSKAYGVTIDALIFGEADAAVMSDLPPEVVKAARHLMKLTRRRRTAVVALILTMS
jgi:transcriptional regulator with XRE-family HTH domain